VYVIDGPKKGESFALTKDSMTIGRSQESDICISEIGISRRHATLLKRDDAYYIIDTSSFQGVFVDGKKIEPGQEVPLSKKSILILGNTILSFDPKPPAEAHPQPPSSESTITFFDKSTLLSVKDSTRNYIRSLELLIRVSNILSQSLNIDEVLNEVVDQVLTLLKRIDRGAILLLNRRTKKLEVVVSKIRTHDGVTKNAKVKFSRTIVKRAFKEGRPITMSDTSNEDKADLSQSIEIMNIRSVMCVPLRYKGEAIGIVYVDSLGVPDGFRSDDLNLLTGLTNTAAIAIQNARLYETMKQELSERREAEKQLENACSELQETRDLLVQSEKLAAIGRVSAGVAHEILNPVNIMSMRLQLLKGIQDLPKQVTYALDIFENQLKRVTDIIDTLGQFSRAPGEAVTMNDLSGFMKNVLVICAPELKEKKIKASLRIQEGLPPVPMEKLRITQAFLNILSNAMEAMEGAKGKRLDISVARSETEDHALVTISDTGSGIAEKDMGKIFDPFFTTRDPSQNTGLGLFVTQTIIEEHGGRVWAESNKDGGASFFVELPFHPKEG